MGVHKALPFQKIVGTGNDFVFIDLRENALAEFTRVSRRELVQRICRRHTGVGSDGVVFVERNRNAAAGEAELKWDFFNSDGSQAAMCGNALRCMGRWAHEAMNVDQIRFGTQRGDVAVHFDGHDFHAALAFLKIEPRTIFYSVGGEARSAVLVNTGVPHVVVEISSLDDAQVKSADITALRFHAETGKEGANVTFLERVSAEKFRTITFERGVENFTLSCGTGVLAAAAVGTGVSHKQPPDQERMVMLEAPGGSLRVKFEAGLNNVILIGSANRICSGQLDEEILK